MGREKKIIKSFRISHQAMDILKNKAKEYNTNMTQLLEDQAFKLNDEYSTYLLNPHLHPPKLKPLKIHNIKRRTQT